MERKVTNINTTMIIIEYFKALFEFHQNWFYFMKSDFSKTNENFWWWLNL
jgi:hypothetical protein